MTNDEPSVSAYVMSNVHLMTSVSANGAIDGGDKMIGIVTGIGIEIEAGLEEIDTVIVRQHIDRIGEFHRAIEAQGQRSQLPPQPKHQYRRHLWMTSH